jgi:hypothetical protein
MKGQTTQLIEYKTWTEPSQDDIYRGQTHKRCLTSVIKEVKLRQQWETTTLPHKTQP